MFFDPKQLKIVPASRKHAYAITVLTRRFFPYVNFSFDVVLERLSSNSIKYLVAEYQGHSIGFADVEFMTKEEASENMRTIEGSKIAGARSNKTAKILGLAILPEFQGRKIGKKLFTRLLGLAKKNCSEAFILVSEDNMNARHLYDEFKFVNIGVLDRQLGGKKILLLKRAF